MSNTQEDGAVVVRLNEAVLGQMIFDLDATKKKADAWLATYHDLGQTRWLGGPKEAGYFVAPKKRVQTAFREMHRAMDALQKASHELAMFRAETDDYTDEGA